MVNKPPVSPLGGPTPYLQDPDLTIYNGDVREVLRELPDESVQMCVTSPPYLGLRDYGMDGQIGLEPTINDYVDALVGVFAEVRRVLRNDGTCWLNLGDSYNAYNGGAGPSSKLSQTQSAVRPQLASGFGLQQKELKPKDLMMIPARVALALQADGWYLRSEITWCKPNPMPESVTDRPTQATEKVYLLTKSPRYFYDAEAVREPWTSGRDDMREKGVRTGDAYLQQGPGAYSNHAKGPDGRRKTTVKGQDGSLQHRNGERWPNSGRNLRNWWEIATEPYPEAHFATYPTELVRRCIAAGSAEGDVVLDPFGGSGTTGFVARKLSRRAILVELSPDYCALAAKRLSQLSLLAEPAA